jgi:pyrroloquinoline quinone biosynthesis protein B
MPEVIVLGIAQDGGVPHAGCRCSTCNAARENPSRRHFTVSLGIISGSRFAMVDATQDFAHQHHMLWSRATTTGEVECERFPAPEAVVITHAHTGHYSGLWQLDRSVLAAKDVVVYCPPATAGLISSNEPFRAMEHEGFIRIAPVQFTSPFELLPDVELELVSVPHRSEWDTDTAAIAIRGSEQSLLYLPDIDSWSGWERDIVSYASEFNIILIDGCFWEAPPRKGVPHPPITESMDLLQAMADAAEVKIVFTHINHSNPVLIPGSEEAGEVVRRGFHIAREGDSFGL